MARTTTKRTSKSKAFALSTRHLTTLKLPYPPSINRYYGTRGKQTFIRREGREYRDRVMDILVPVFHELETYGGPLQVWIEVFQPDRRRRDLDNISKALLDAITHSGVWLDDSQIVDLRYIRSGVEKGGYVRLHISEVTDAPSAP